MRHIADISERLEELRLTLSKGPCVDPFIRGGTVLTPDLRTDEAPSRRPVFAAAEAGASAVFAFDRIDAGQGSPVDNFKKISSWAAILFGPTLVETIYGMNFHNMPELRWGFGYPFAIGLIGVVCVSLYVIFKRRDWL